MKLITAKGIVAAAVEDMGINAENVDMPIFVRWANEALDRLELYESLETKVDLLPIKGYTAARPPHLKMICEVAAKQKELKRNCDEIQIIGEQIVQWKQEVTPDGCELEINLNCLACKKVDCECGSIGVAIDIDQAWLDARPEYYYRDFVQYAGKHTFGKGISVHHPKFELLKPTSNIWDGVKHIPKCANLTCTETCYHSYTLKKTVIDTSIKDGHLLISYMTPCLDEDGNKVLEISDRDGIQAAIEYIKMKYFEKEYQITREASSLNLSDRAAIRYEDGRNKYCAKKAVQGIEEMFHHLFNSKNKRMMDGYELALSGYEQNSRDYLIEYHNSLLQYKS